MADVTFLVSQMLFILKADGLEFQEKMLISGDSS